MRERSVAETSSGNVFADIGLANADEHLVKAKLVYKIDGLMKARGLKQAEAARLFRGQAAGRVENVARRLPPVLGRTPDALSRRPRPGTSKSSSSRAEARRRALRSTWRDGAQKG